MEMRPGEELDAVSEGRAVRRVAVTLGVVLVLLLAACSGAGVQPRDPLAPPEAVAAQLETQPHLMHACEAETSMVWHLHPAGVRPDQLERAHGPMTSRCGDFFAFDRAS